MVVSVIAYATILSKLHFIAVVIFFEYQGSTLGEFGELQKNCGLCKAATTQLRAEAFVMSQSMRSSLPLLLIGLR